MRTLALDVATPFGLREVIVEAIGLPTGSITEFLCPILKVTHKEKGTSDRAWKRYADALTDAISEMFYNESLSKEREGPGMLLYEEAKRSSRVRISMNGLAARETGDFLWERGLHHEAARVYEMCQAHGNTFGQVDYRLSMLRCHKGDHVSALEGACQNISTSLPPDEVLAVAKSNDPIVMEQYQKLILLRAYRQLARGMWNEFGDGDLKRMFSEAADRYRHEACGVLGIDTRRAILEEEWIGSGGDVSSLVPLERALRCNLLEWNSVEMPFREQDIEDALLFSAWRSQGRITFVPSDSISECLFPELQRVPRDLPIRAVGKGFFEVRHLEGQINRAWFQERRSPLFTLDAAVMEAGERVLSALGVDPRAERVLISLRGSEDVLQELEPSLVLPDSYEARMSWISCSPRARALSCDPALLLDFTHSWAGCTWGQRFLAAASQLVITNDPAVMRLADIFGNWALCLEHDSPAPPPYHPHRLYTLPLVRKGHSERLLTIREMYSGEYARILSSPNTWEALGVSRVDLPLEAHREVLAECLSRKSGTWRDSPEDLQVRSLWLKALRDTRIPQESIGEVATSFLRRYPELLG